MVLHASVKAKQRKMRRTKQARHRTSNIITYQSLVLYIKLEPQGRTLTKISFLSFAHIGQRKNK